MLQRILAALLGLAVVVVAFFITSVLIAVVWIWDQAQSGMPIYKKNWKILDTM